MQIFGVSTTVLAFVLLCNTRFSFHCEPTPTQKSARKWQVQPFATSSTKDYEGHSLVQTIWCHVPSTAIHPRETCIQLIRSLHADSCEFYPRQNKQGRWHLLQCYRVDKGAGTVTTVDKNTCQSSFFSSRAFKFFVTFSFTPHSFFFRKLIFGDIKFNIKVSMHVSSIKIS